MECSLCGATDTELVLADTEDRADGSLGEDAHWAMPGERKCRDQFACYVRREGGNYVPADAHHL